MSLKVIHQRFQRSILAWACGVSIGGILAMTALAFVLPLTQASDTPQGMVEEPRLGAYGVAPAQEAAFEFKGWVNFSRDEGIVRIDVFDNNASSWVEGVAEARPSDTSRIVNGQERFSWSTERIQIFKPESGQNRWPEGGTARVRFRAIVTHSDGTTSSAQLPVRDSDGVPGFINELILADKNPSPAAPLQGGTPNYLNRRINPSTRTPEKETDRYYKTVGTDPDGKGDSIETAIPNLDAFLKRYFGSGPGVVAKYFNRGDLGLGREMHCMPKNADLETACYVRNFGSRDGTLPPRFNGMGESFEALNAHKPFATVAMVERGKIKDPLAPNKVFFVVYGADGNLPKPGTAKAPLDTKEFNTFIPGNCLVCHGAGTYEADDQPKVRGARFLPFDLSSFRYYPSDSRASQEDEFKQLNQIVYNTDLGDNPDARELIEGWYGRSDQFPRETFDDDFVPEGWDDNKNTIQLYRHVVAPTCRSCHISNSTIVIKDPKIRFGSLGSLQSFATQTLGDICSAHSMPNAEQSLKVFWESSARAQLLNRLNITSGGCEPQILPMP